MPAVSNIEGTAALEARGGTHTAFEGSSSRGVEHSFPGTNSESPDDSLLRFVDRLPTTIRNVVLARCCLAFGRLQYPPTKQDLFATFRAILTAGEGEARAYLCAKMAASVELALHRGAGDSDERLEQELFDAVDSHRIDNIDLRGPLARKHWRAAREEFSALRKDVLSVESIAAMLNERSADAPTDQSRFDHIHS